jgi:hypothetical protein
MQENKVYHYTSLESLNKIINQANEQDLKLRATHIDFLNDYTEHSIAIYLLKNKLIEYDNSLDKSISKNFHTLLNDKRMSFFRYEEIDDLYPFIISFSECWDSLPMWNTYGNKSKGVALGFDKDKLSKLQGYKFEKCIYDTNEYENYLSKNIEQLHRCIIINSYSIGFISGSDSKLLNQHFKYLPKLKNKYYNYEDEYRLIIPSNIVEKEELKFQTSDTLLKPYKEISIPFEYLTEIVLGPQLNLEKLKTSLFILLEQKNKLISLDKEDGKIHLRKSNIPYREI